MYRIYIRDSSLNKIGELTDYTKLELIPRFNAVGSFALDLPTDSFAARELIKPRSGIIVKKDGLTVFSGTVTGRKRSFNGTDDTLTLSGKDDMLLLSSRLAFPTPSGIFTESDYDVRTGAAESIMKQFVDNNCGPSGLIERKLVELETDTGVGAVVTGRARFDNLIDILASIANQGGGLGFNVVQEGGSLIFKVYQPQDNTKSVLFSPLLGNLASFEYSDDDPEANFVIVGGSGEGTARIIKQKSNNESLVKFGRIETFVDQRNTSEDAELDKSADEELANKSEKVSINFTPIDTPSISFGRDYGLGDKVSVILTQPGEVVTRETVYRYVSFYQSVKTTNEFIRKTQNKLDVIQDIVREVKITIDSNGETVQPTVGNDGSRSSVTFGLFDKMTKAFKRIGNLERR
jgi:hypothetical protein